jgi:transcriptional regulator with XRE-family HTH domain
MATRTLRILREVNNYTQAHVSENILGISQNTYSRLEQNPNKITAEQAQKLSALYNVSIAKLLSEVTPIIMFEDSIEENKEGGTDINAQHHHVSFEDTTAITLKEQNELLMQQNAALMELVKAVKSMSNAIHLKFQQSSGVYSNKQF